jgi:cytochrome c553
MKSRFGARAAFVASLALAALPLRGQPLLPQGDPAQGRAVAEHVCVACHGVDGNNADPARPRLAGQSARYLYEQLLVFHSQGERRANGVMGAIAVNLSDAEMRDVAAWFSRQPVQDTPPQVNVGADLLRRGEKIYRRGIVGSPSVPACASCHALSGAGLAPEFPRLAGQHEAYLVQQLDNFRSGRRTSNPNELMARVAHKLTDADIAAVAAYIARMR